MAYDFYGYEDIGEEEWPEGRPRDAKVDEAREELTRFFKEHAEGVYYLKQLEVFFEKCFFHWITAKAVNELIEDGLLGKDEIPLSKGTKVKFVFNKRYRDHKMPIRKSIEIIRQYSNPTIAIACGRQAEVLFFNALMNKGFLSKEQEVNEYSGKKWTETEHDLDFIIEKDNIVYGCEVKNKWDYIERDELTIKLRICDFLGVKPLFIMRYSPKTYTWEIIQRGGYTMIFETQIYPFGQKELVEKMKEVLGLPVDCPRAIPAGIIDRFMRWHKRNVTGVDSRNNSRKDI